MKLKIVWIVFCLSIVLLLLFQSVWLYNMYHKEKANVEDCINLLLTESVGEELKNRTDEYLSGEEFTYMSTEEALRDTTKYKTSEIINMEEMVEASIFQQVLKFIGVPVQVSFIDSVFLGKIDSMNISDKYLLVYKDSIGTILEQKGNLASSKISSSFRTDSLLIIDGKRIQAVVDIAPLVVFRQMMWLLIASFFMLLIITYCIYYQAKTLFTQYKLNRLRDDFVHALTHDMKTPLGTINVVLAQFRSGALDNNPEMKEKFGAIAMDQVSSLLMLVEKILTIAKLEHGKLVPEYMVADIPQMVKELSERFFLSKNKKVEILSSFDLEDRTIRLDSTLIKDAVGNLIENSVKYSGDEVKILVDCYIKNELLFIRVRDNGFGIPEEDREKIFEKFERGIAVERRGAKGFGLGLNYVKRVAEAHSGIVTLFSTEGEGSEFTMVLPLK